MVCASEVEWKEKGMGWKTRRRGSSLPHSRQLHHRHLGLPQESICFKKCWYRRSFRFLTLPAVSCPCLRIPCRNVGTDGCANTAKLQPDGVWRTRTQRFVWMCTDDHGDSWFWYCFFLTLVQHLIPWALATPFYILTLLRLHYPSVIEKWSIYTED